MRRGTTLLLLPICLTLAGGTACADYVLIKYRSGNVQTLRLDEPSRNIASISYREDNASATEPPPSRPAKAGAAGTTGEAATTPQKSTGTPPANGKPEVRFEWAPPVE